MKKMKRLYLSIPIILLAFLLFSSDPVRVSAAKTPVEVQKAKKSIQGRMILSHIQFLASSHCRGREPGDSGMAVADTYIQSVLNGIGVSPASIYGNYFQKVPLETIDLSPKVHLIVKKKRLMHRARIAYDFLPIYLSAERHVKAPLVFAGYGITAPEHKYDDYRNIDVRNKIVLLLRHEPGERDPDSPFDGTKLSKHGTYLSKIKNAQKHGAVAVLFVTDPLNHKQLTVTGGFFSGTSWAAIRKARLKTRKDYSFLKISERMRIIGDHFGVRIPVAHISGELAESILQPKRDLLSLQKKIDRNLKPVSFAIEQTEIDLSIYYKRSTVKAHNIVAKIEGSDPELKKEVVIIGAHYDHIGPNNRGQIHGGADDNASGSAAVLELARAFQMLKKKPKRTILFILFTAEEKGLLGSRYYVKDPLFPLNKTLAMFNLDMIGRNDVDQLNVLGKYQYPKLFRIVDRINKKTVNMSFNFTVEDSVRNSDHFPFMREEIPVVFFISGLHDHYHTPRDTADKIVTEKLEKVTQLVFLSLFETANLPAGTDLRKKGGKK